MAAALKIARLQPLDYSPKLLRTTTTPAKALELPEFTGVFRGRELTRKDRRLISGLTPIDSLIGGGIVRGRISEILGAAGSGKTSLAAAFVANTTRHGKVAAWIDAADNFDPESMVAAGVDLARMLWVSCRYPNNRSRRFPSPTTFDDEDGISMNRRRRLSATSLKAAEWILAAGGFGLVVIDFGEETRALPQSSALRLARAAERSGAAVLALAPHRMCGTFAALSLTLRRNRTYFSRTRPGAPALFDGLKVAAHLARNKLGGSGRSVNFSLLCAPCTDELQALSAPHEVQYPRPLHHIQMK
jgi:hypothetical protein